MDGKQWGESAALNYDRFMELKKAAGDTWKDVARAIGRSHNHTRRIFSRHGDSPVKVPLQFVNKLGARYGVKPLTLISRSGQSGGEEPVWRYADWLKPAETEALLERIRDARWVFVCKNAMEPYLVPVPMMQHFDRLRMNALGWHPTTQQRWEEEARSFTNRRVEVRDKAGYLHCIIGPERLFHRVAELAKKKRYPEANDWIDDSAKRMLRFGDRTVVGLVPWEAWDAMYCRVAELIGRATWDEVMLVQGKSRHDRIAVVCPDRYSSYVTEDASAVESVSAALREAAGFTPGKSFPTGERVTRQQVEDASGMSVKALRTIARSDHLKSATRPPPEPLEIVPKPCPRRTSTRRTRTD